MKAALIGPGGELLHQARRTTGRERGPDAVVDGDPRLRRRAARLRHRRTSASRAAAAGVAVPGIVDAEQRHRRLRGQPGLARRPPARAARRPARRCPVALGHDVRTGGLAEGRIGAGQGADRFLFVALGTGIAGAIGVDGRVEAGAHGFAGEIGHIVVRPGGDPVSVRAARLSGTVRVRGGGQRGVGRGLRDPGADAADCAKAVESGDPSAAGLAGRRRRPRRRPASPPSPCWTRAP